MSKALEGVNVLEFSSHLGAAYAAMLMAEQGARAIKVEPPGGAPGRGTPHFSVLNRSKQSLYLDLESATGRSDANELIKHADVIIAGATPLRLRAIGLDYPSVRQINPSAIALYLPPLGSSGREAEFEASEELVAALGGIAGNQWARSGNPVPLAYSLRPLESLRSWRVQTAVGNRSKFRCWRVPSRFRPAESCGTKR
jgi:crotonobetainyl-CoA:carnitine CoA-transferase CaiB-like acyl-CoA transferase